MSTSARRIALAFLWLAIAVLPARGWANVLMHLPGGHSGHGGQHVAMPCHEAAQAPSVGDDATEVAGKACTLCGVCHGAALPSRLVVLAGTQGGAVWKQADMPAPPARSTGTLFRPPRA